MISLISRGCRVAAFLAGAVVLGLGALPSSAQTSFVWTNLGGAWSVANNWTNFPPAGSTAPLAGGSNDYVLSFLKAGSYAATNNLAATSFALNQLVFSNAAVTIAGSNLQFVAAGTGGALPQILQNSSTAVVINASVTLGTNLTFGGVGGGTMTVGGAIGGAGSITKTSTNTLTLNGANSFAGNLLVAGGTLQVNADAALGSAANAITLSNAAVRGTTTFTLGSSRTVTIMSGTTGTLNNLVLDQPTQLSGSGRLQVSGNGVFLSIMTNQVNYTGDAILVVGVSGTAYLRAPFAMVSNSHLVLTAAVYEGVGPTTFTWTNAPGGGVGTYEAGGVPGWSAYNGRMVVNLGGAGAPINMNVGAGNLGSSSGLNLSSPTANDVTEFVNALVIGTGRIITVSDNPATNTDLALISGVVSGAGSLTKAQAGTLWLTATSAHTGGVILGSGALRANDGVGLNTNELLTMSGGVLESDGTTSFTRPLGTGAGQLVWTNGGGFSAFGGKMTVNVGGSTGTLVYGSTPYFMPMVTTNLSMVFGSVTADSEVEFQNGIDFGGGTRSITVNDNAFTNTDYATISGAISNGVLIKAGTGVLSLKNPNNAYTGTTNSAGMIALAGDYVLGTGPLVLAGGGLQALGATARTVTNRVVYTANATLGAAGTGDLLFNQATNDLGGVRTLTVSNGVTTFSGITTNASLTKAGPGTLVLNTAYLTNLAVSASGGTLQILGGSSTSPSLSLTGTNSTLLLSGAGTRVQAAGVLTMNGVGSLNNAFRVLNGATNIVTGLQIGGSSSGAIGGTSSNAVEVAGPGSFLQAGPTYLGGSNLLGGAQSSGNAILVTNAGVFYHTGGDFYVGRGADTGGSLVLVDGANSLFFGTNMTLIRMGSGTGGTNNRIVVSGGGLFVAGQPTGSIQMNYDASSVGSSILVTGPNSTFSNLVGLVRVGDAGGGALFTVNSNATAYAGGGVTVGYASTSTQNSFLLSGSGSVANVAGAFLVGDSGSSNAALVTGGARLNIGSGGVGNSTGKGNRLTVSTGAVVTSTGGFNVGPGSGSLDNSLIVDSGGLLVNSGVLNVGNTGVGASLASNASFVVCNATVSNLTGDVTIGNIAYASSMVVSNHGTLLVGGTFMVSKGNYTGGGGAGSASGNTALLTDGSVLSIATNFVVGGGTTSHNNSMVVSNGASITASVGQVGGGTGGTNNSLILTGPGTFAQFQRGIQAGINGNISGSSSPNGTGYVLVVDGAMLETVRMDGGTSGSGGITSLGGIFQFITNTPVINLGTAGSIGVNSGTVSFRGVTNAVIDGQITNFTYSGANTLRLDAATNSALSYAISNGATFSALELINNGAMWQGPSLLIGSGGLLRSSNANAILSAVLTNSGTVSVINGQLTYLSNVVLNGGLFLTQNGTNNFTRGLGMAAGATLTFTSGNSRVDGSISSSGTINTVNANVTFGGPLVISGSYVSDPSTNIFTSNVTVTASGSISGSNGDLFVFNQDFLNQSTNAAQFNLSHAAVLFTNSAAHLLSVSNSGALDLGHFTNFAQVATNFAIGQLSIASGNRVTLAGNRDSRTNALYVGWLDIQGSIDTNDYTSVTNGLVAALNLPNINLYYDVYDPRNDWLTHWLPPVSGGGYDLWDGGGLLLPIPEPSALVTMGGGLVLLGLLRRRRA